MNTGTILNVIGAILLCISIILMIIVVYAPSFSVVIGFIGLFLLIIGFSKKSAGKH